MDCIECLKYDMIKAGGTLAFFSFWDNKGLEANYLSYLAPSGVPTMDTLIISSFILRGRGKDSYPSTGPPYHDLFLHSLPGLSTSGPLPLPSPAPFSPSPPISPFPSLFLYIFLSFLSTRFPSQFSIYLLSSKQFDSLPPPGLFMGSLVIWVTISY